MRKMRLGQHRAVRSLDKKKTGPRTPLCRALFRTFALALVLASLLLAQKRPLTHADYDSWRHIQDQQLSNDGHYLAFALFPQQGDGELIVRDLVTGKEMRQPIGELPSPPPPNYAIRQIEDSPPPKPGIAVKFSQDSRTLVVLTFPTHADVENTKRQKRKSPDAAKEDTPKGDLVVIDLLSRAVFRAPRVKSFQLPTRANGFVAYRQLPEKSASEKPCEDKSADVDEQPEPKKIETGDLVLRSLEDGAERRFRDVADYALTNDAELLVYAVQSPNPDSSGMYVIKTGTSANPAALLSGKGKYEKVAWDEDQTRLAFLTDHADSDSPHPRFALYDWDRKRDRATQRVSVQTAGFHPGWIISDKAPITFSKNGNRIFFGTAPASAPDKLPDPTPADERVRFDLWSWRDDYIQPMQKIRASVEHSRSYRAAYDVQANKFVHLADPSMLELAPSDEGSYAIGGDDREYRRMQEFDRHYEDAYIVNTASGERKLVAKKHIGRITWSPDGKYATYFNGKDWLTIAVPSGETINLTSKLGVSFAREDYDLPGLPPSYNLAGWTRDRRYVLINDRFDIWRVKPDGSSAINLTSGLGRKDHLVFRLVRYEHDDPADRWIDPSKPLLFRTENDDTHDSGFYRTSIEANGPPEKLVMARKNFTPPIKARDAEVYALTASTFREYPDLLITDGTFREFRKVSNANPQLANLNWGTAELIHLKSVDGVPLKGILYKPDNFDPKKKYPMLVYIYERLSQGLNNFIEPRPAHNINISYYVSNGYLVLEPDIAYKIGYPGQSALGCVLPAIQEIVNQGFVNENAIGIQGHSWGGYQVAYMITRTNRFHAAAAGAPVVDMISAYDAIRWGPGLPRQLQYEHSQSRIGGDIWEFPLRFIENSPIFAADRVNTPLLMLHNDADDAVPWSQGIEYYLALRRLNKEVYMFSYNGEAHGLRRRANQKDYTVRLQEFFDYYLKGAPKPDWMEHGIPYLNKHGVTIADSQ
jgi:dipeptidyl aminopeptidase/acylaminoacyl peptidase